MKPIFFALILLLCGAQVLAQDAANADKDKQYVTDQLRLSLYEDANSKSKVLKLLQSGDALLIDEIRGPYALVTAPDGTRGWVKRGFLVTSPTSNLLLREEREKNASLFEEIEKLSNSKTIVATYEKDMDKMTSDMELLRTENQQAEEAIARLQQEILEYQREEDQSIDPDAPSVQLLWEAARYYWKFIVPGVIVILLLCFVISKTIIESRIKARFHGIKIW